MKLFCIPHAGASSVSYHVWRSHLDERIKFLPLELPGHMTRSSEPLCEKLDDIVIDLTQLIKNNLKHSEQYAIYGHSMGGLLLYFLYFSLIENGFQPPAHLFFSSRWPPYHNNTKAYLDINNLNECKSRILEMGGFKAEILNNQEMLDYYMQILIADYRVIQSVSDIEPQKLDSDMTVLWSDKEPDIHNDDVYKWKLAAGSGIAFVKVKGTHFFPTEDPEKTTSIINNTLKKYILET